MWQGVPLVRKCLKLVRLYVKHSWTPAHIVFFYMLKFFTVKLVIWEFHFCPIQHYDNFSDVEYCTVKANRRSKITLICCYGSVNILTLKKFHSRIIMICQYQGLYTFLTTDRHTFVGSAHGAKRRKRIIFRLMFAAIIFLWGLVTTLCCLVATTF